MTVVGGTGPSGLKWPIEPEARGLGADANDDMIPPPDYDSWPQDKKNAWWAEQTKRYRERETERKDRKARRPNGPQDPNTSPADKLLLFTPTPFKPTDPTKFPRRQFLYGRHYVRKYVSATIAPGDTGKTSLNLAEAIAMASGVPFLGVRFRQQYKV